MSITIEVESPDLITIRVSGKIGSSEWLSAQQDIARRMRLDRLTSLLVIAEGFEGWERGDWDDMSFQLQHDDQIARMAVVAEQKWKDQAMMFAGKGLRKFEIRHFPPAEIAQARAWSRTGGAA